MCKRIIELWETGIYGYRAIAKKMGVCPQTVRDIINSHECGIGKQSPKPSELPAQP